MEYEVISSMILPVSFGFALTVLGGLFAWGLTVAVRLIKNMMKGV